MDCDLKRVSIFGSSGSVGGRLRKVLDARDDVVVDAYSRFKQNSLNLDSGIKCVDYEHLVLESLSDAYCICVGSFERRLLSDVDEPHLDEMVHANLKTPIILTKKIIESILGSATQDLPRKLVIVGSSSAFRGSSSTSCYSAAKAGLRGFVTAINDEMRELDVGLRVVLFSMGTINNEMGVKTVGEEVFGLIDESEFCECLADELLMPSSFFEPERLLRRRNYFA